jgi:hypothetical protein
MFYSRTPAWIKANKAKHKALGLCINCTRKPLRGHQLCRQCNESTRRARAKWAKKHPKLARKSARESRDRRRKALKAAIFAKLGETCRHCGFADKRALQIDHVRGRGKAEYKRFTDILFLKRVLNDTTDAYQILCANCNWIKRHTNNEVKHGRRHPSWRSN